MKARLKKWAFRLAITGLFIAGLLLVIVLNPMLTYASKTAYSNYTIFHNKPLDCRLRLCLDQAMGLVAASECYNSALKLDICLNDGSKYPVLMQCIRGQAFAWGFYDKVVLMGSINYTDNYVELNGYKWNLTQLLAHEMMHCFQLDKRGFWRSNPVAKIPAWKWEGYPEYVARQDDDQKDLSKNIDRLLRAGQTDNNGWIQFADSTGTVIPYYKNWLLIQFCLDIKKLTYTQVIDDTTAEAGVRQQMMTWYYERK